MSISTNTACPRHSIRETACQPVYSHLLCRCQEAYRELKSRPCSWSRATELKCEVLRVSLFSRQLGLHLRCHICQLLLPLFVFWQVLLPEVVEFLPRRTQQLLELFDFLVSFVSPWLSISSSSCLRDWRYVWQRVSSSRVLLSGPEGVSSLGQILLLQTTARDFLYTGLVCWDSPF